MIGENFWVSTVFPLKLKSCEKLLDESFIAVLDLKSIFSLVHIGKIKEMISKYWTVKPVTRNI